MGKELFVPIVSILMTAFVSFGASWYWFHRTDKRNVAAAKVIADDKLREEVEELKRQLSVLGLQVQPIWTAAQALLVKQLTHFHTPELDALLAKLDPLTLTLDEAERMKVLLEARERDMNGRIDDSEREAALMLPFVVRRVRAEVAQTDQAAKVDMKVVTVPAEKPDDA